MKKRIAALLLFFAAATCLGAYEIYNTAGKDYTDESTYRGYIVFTSESEYEQNKELMKKCRIYTTDREVDFIPSRSQELSAIIAYRNVRPGAYIVEFIVEEVPGNGQNWIAVANYRYGK